MCIRDRINWFSDSAALTTWGELNWLKSVNETQKTKTAKLIKTSFTKFWKLLKLSLQNEGTINGWLQN